MTQRALQITPFGTIDSDKKDDQCGLINRASWRESAVRVASLSVRAMQLLMLKFGYSIYDALTYPSGPGCLA